MSSARLTLEKIAVRFGGLIAVRDLSLSLAPGEIRGLIGPNGAGKTTAVNAISGVVPIEQGRILLDGDDVSGLAPHDLSRKGIARTFQHVEAFGDMTVLENVMIGVARHAPVSLWSAAVGTPFARRTELAYRKDALDILKLFELEGYQDTVASELPFGLLKRMDLARALASRPKILLLDEPTSGMSESEADSAIQAVRRLAEQFSMTLLVIEHNMRVMMALADVVTVMQQGAVIAEGTPHEIQNDPVVIAAYLGDEDADA